MLTPDIELVLDAKFAGWRAHFAGRPRQIDVARLTHALAGVGTLDEATWEHYRQMAEKVAAAYAEVPSPNSPAITNWWSCDKPVTPEQYEHDKPMLIGAMARQETHLRIGHLWWARTWSFRP